MNSAVNIIITGGKTGGHLFPGIAVAQAVLRLREDVKLLFVGTTAPFEVKTLKQYGFNHKAIISRPMKGGSIPAKLFSGIVLIISLIQSLFMLAWNRPGFVLGVGGFSSFSVVLAAWLLRIPTGIQEQNAIPGLTNRLLARFAGTIFTSFKNTRGLSDLAKTRFVGNPTRKVDAADNTDASDINHFNTKNLTLLVTGGSQGASSINHAVVDAFEQLGDNAAHYNVIHQTGTADEQWVKDRYRELNIPFLAGAFFSDMPRLQEKADIVISRAGAGTISELCGNGKPAILVPYPHAADDHQTMNAKNLVEQDACIMIQDSDISGEILSRELESFRKAPERITGMGRQMKALAMPDADQIIAEHILGIIGDRG